MAELKCAVDNCAYNRSECCCKGDIMVGGKRACCEDETCGGKLSLQQQLQVYGRACGHQGLRRLRLQRDCLRDLCGEIKFRFFVKKVKLAGRKPIRDGLRPLSAGETSPFFLIFG